ncbi:MAG: M24 family metallopeptidase [Candidatus Bathyarchaeia archaeon]
METYIPEGRMEYPASLLTLKERDRRWRAIREEMKKRQLGCLIVYGCVRGSMIAAPNVRYVTGGDGYECHCVFPIDKDPVHLVWYRAAAEAARKMCWVDDIRVAGGLLPSYALANCVKDLGYGEGNIGIVGVYDYFHPEGWIPYNTYTYLQKFLPKARFYDVATMMTDIRMVKSDEEIEFAEKAAELGDMAIEVMAGEAKPGAKENQMYADMIHTITRNGGDVGVAGSWILMSSGSFIHQAHYFPEHRTLKPGDVILTELYPRFGGYYAHPHQPVFIGRVDRDYELCREAVLESIDAGLKAMVPGATYNEVDEAFGRAIQERGLFHDHCSIHGVGLDSPEPPVTVMERTLPLDPKYPGYSAHKVPEAAPYVERTTKFLAEGKIKPNMVIAVEPMAAKRVEGTLFERGVHMGPTVVTTDSRPRMLNRYGRDVIRV